MKRRYRIVLAEGHKNREVADHLCISVKTVEKHRSNLMQKLDLHSASGRIAYAIWKWHAIEKWLVTK